MSPICLLFESKKNSLKIITNDDTLVFDKFTTDQNDNRILWLTPKNQVKLIKKLIDTIEA